MTSRTAFPFILNPFSSGAARSRWSAPASSPAAETATADAPSVAVPLSVVCDVAGPGVVLPIAGWSHPESVYERDHVNCEDGNLHAWPERPAGSVNRFSGRGNV